MCKKPEDIYTCITQARIDNGEIFTKQLKVQIEVLQRASPIRPITDPRHSPLLHTDLTKEQS